MRNLLVSCGTTLIVLVAANACIAADLGANFLSTLHVPDGFTIELVAGPPLVERPITAAFDDEGRLYVAESSGSNDPVAKQLQERPHRVVRLEDVDGDGEFDRRVVFADRMMFPAGTMYLDGSLYVAAPPSIWKLTDIDGDGVADERVEWFQGKTLTGCANDLHGPYFGPDGWIYWCKGGFAEQNYKVNGRPWKSRAAHIFRCRPDGGGLEPVMTGGMDNPVDVVFMPHGEPILSATYLVGEGRRDGLAHVIYGGVYGKEHGVLDGHPRTGELMPALALMSPAAPSGLERYDASAFGDDYRDNLFTCQFNHRKVSRHVLRPAGSSFVSTDSDFVTSDNVDFHPTDVLMDADGSLLVIDTGGWYKLCCPTSQLWKPDVLGGIYRVRRDGAETPSDPRGRNMAWAGLSVEKLWAHLGDKRSAVRQRATRTFAHRRDSPEMQAFLAHLAKSPTAAEILTTGPKDDAEAATADRRAAALARTWALTQVDSAASRALTRTLLHHPDEHVRHAALHAVSLHRETGAMATVVELLGRDTAPNRRLAAAALGRMGDRSAVPHLLAAAVSADDRALQHSVIYALIELADTTATQAGASGETPDAVAAALTALDQMPGGAIHPRQVVPLLSSPDDRLRLTARWLVMQHPEWGGHLANWFSEQLAELPDPSPAGADGSTESPVESMLVGFASQADVQRLLADLIVAQDRSMAARQLALRVVASSNVRKPPAEWSTALAQVIADGDPQLLALAVAAAGALPRAATQDPELGRALLDVAGESKHALDLRVIALAAATRSGAELTPAQFALIVGALSAENSVAARSAAADSLSRAALTSVQLDALCDLIPSASPLELNRLLTPFERSADDKIGLKLLSSLKNAQSLSSLRIDLLRHTLAKASPAVQEGVNELESLVNVDAAEQRRRIEELLPQMAQGDVRRGHAVYFSSKAACFACHKLGHAGGTVGPELTRIGEGRTDRDLLESILYPSLSFVRSYETVLIFTVDGKAINGRICDENEHEYVLATGLNEETHVRRKDVEDMQPSTISIMPAGLDKQLSVQELADLVAFLRNAKGG